MVLVVGGLGLVVVGLLGCVWAMRCRVAANTLRLAEADERLEAMDERLRSLGVMRDIFESATGRPAPPPKGPRLRVIKGGLVTVPFLWLAQQARAHPAVAAAAVSAVGATTMLAADDPSRSMGVVNPPVVEEVAPVVPDTTTTPGATAPVAATTPASVPREPLPGLTATTTTTAPPAPVTTTPAPSTTVAAEAGCEDPLLLELQLGVIDACV